jgi:putative IMPACT (imprinted ancient) family translation regulator
MNILDAKEIHVDYVAELLAKHFSQANEFFGYAKYKDSFEIMQKHVLKRVRKEVEGFSYFVAEDDSGNPVGFVSLLIEQENVGSILALVAEEKKVMKDLLIKSIDYFKGLGVSNIQGEYFSYENDLKEILMELGIVEELVAFRLKT